MTDGKHVDATVGIPPAVTEETQAFWDAAREGRLLVEHCNSCGADQFPPRGICRTDRSRDTTMIEVTGRGRVYSYTVNYQRWLPELEVPYAIVLVEFPDHPRRAFVRLPGVELFLDLVLDDLALFLDHQDFLESLGEPAGPLRLERP